MSRSEVWMFAGCLSRNGFPSVSDHPHLSRSYPGS
jgi:hypothetical protein